MKIPLLALVFVFAATSATAENPAVVAEGQALAERWCTACHTATATGGSDAVPSFRSIAQRPENDENRLRGFLMAPHPPMPDLSLSNAEVSALVAYIRSQAPE